VARNLAQLLIAMGTEINLREAALRARVPGKRIG
jgi:hypothetical protein